MKRILVTGGFGFIGIHLVKHLLNYKRSEIGSIHVVDNLSSNPLDTREILDYWGNSNQVTFQIGEIGDLLKSETVPFADEIYHLASIVGPVSVTKYPGSIVPMIMNSTEKVFEFGAKINAKLLYVSTSEVYGGGIGGACEEQMNCVFKPNISARLEYAVAKLAMEITLINRCKTGKNRAIIVRPFNVSGPMQSTMGGFVIPRFIFQAINRLPITVYGDGGQSRAFTHVYDIVEALELIMSDGKLGECYNIGNRENKTTILDLAEMVRIVTNSDSTIGFYDPKHLHGPYFEETEDKYPVSGKIEALNWKASRTLNTLVSDSWEFIRQCPDKSKYKLSSGLRNSFAMDEDFALRVV